MTKPELRTCPACENFSAEVERDRRDRPKKWRCHGRSCGAFGVLLDGGAYLAVLGRAPERPPE